ncbi:MAG TPA: glycosyltransferase [Opitutaceae bacterium]|nr:glycosyltransferase [Opitutaceae bacterium]
MASATHLLLLPSYNTGPRLAAVVAEALACWQPVMVVIDGSDDGSDADILALARREPDLTVLRLPRNAGKGAAVLAGAAEAAARGFTHALVMDADGQHPADRIRDFMEYSRQRPEALVLGRPVFGPDVPLERLYFRKLSVALVWLSILGAGIPDPLYGFRVYPLRPLLEALGRTRGGRRYDFDTEAAVRLVWGGTPPHSLPAPVRYFTPAQGGVSHFRYLRDNLRLGAMHCRLFAELVRRWPGVVRARRHWAAGIPAPADAALVSDAAR